MLPSDKRQNHLRHHAIAKCFGSKDIIQEAKALITINFDYARLTVIGSKKKYENTFKKQFQNSKY